MHYVLVVLMAILGAMFPGFLVKAIKSTDKNEADGALFGARVILGMLMPRVSEVLKPSMVSLPRASDSSFRVVGSLPPRKI